jgi:hypothetical protein
MTGDGHGPADRSPCDDHRRENRRPKRRPQVVPLSGRRNYGTCRVRPLLHFGTNLPDSLKWINEAEEEAQTMLLPDDQQRQRRRDIEAMSPSLDERDDEEAASSARSPTGTST